MSCTWWNCVVYGYEMSICRRTLGGIAFGEVSRLVALERVDVDIFFGWILGGVRGLGIGHGHVRVSRSVSNEGIRLE